LIIRVEGYIWKGKPFTDQKDWKEKIPLGHKLEAVSGFLLSGREDVPEDASLIEAKEGFDLAESGIEMKFAIFQNGKTERVCSILVLLSRVTIFALLASPVRCNFRGLNSVM